MQFPQIPPSLLSRPDTCACHVRCLEHLSPILYLGNLHSLGSNLENASFLILKEWVKRPHSGPAQHPAEGLSLCITSAPCLVCPIYYPTSRETQRKWYLVHHCLSGPVHGADQGSINICWINVFVYRQSLYKKKSRRDYYECIRSYSQMEIEDRTSVKWKGNWKFLSIYKNLIYTQKFQGLYY